MVEATSELVRLAALNKLRVVDLTQPINSKIPSIDGNPDAFHYGVLTATDVHGHASGAFKIEEHVGTHMDAPVHFIAGKDTIDQLPIDRLILPAVVIDAISEANRNAGYELTVAKIQEWEAWHGRVPDGSAFLLMTGWDKRYCDPERYFNRDNIGRPCFPGYSEESANYLVHERHVAILGIDTFSVDIGLSERFGVHKAVLANDSYIIENLCNLHQLPARGASIFCGPLPIQGGTGSPCRVLALID